MVSVYEGTGQGWISFYHKFLIQFFLDNTEKRLSFLVFLTSLLFCIWVQLLFKNIYNCVFMYCFNLEVIGWVLLCCGWGYVVT